MKTARISFALLVLIACAIRNPISTLQACPGRCVSGWGWIGWVYGTNYGLVPMAGCSRRLLKEQGPEPYAGPTNACWKGTYQIPFARYLQSSPLPCTSNAKIGDLIWANTGLADPAIDVVNGYCCQFNPNGSDCYVDPY